MGIPLLPGHATVLIPALNVSLPVKYLSMLLVTKPEPVRSRKSCTPAWSDEARGDRSPRSMSYHVKVKGSENAQVFEELCRLSHVRVTRSARKWWHIKYRMHIFGPSAHVRNLIAALRKQFS